MRVADFAFDFRFRRQRRNGVNDDNVYRTGTCQRVTDFQSLFAGIRLGAQQVVDIDAQLACVNRVQRVFRIDKRTGFAFALRAAITCSVSVVLPEDSGP
ncbi:Uncharacterised protein [Klebsiella michiganensis]|nr:Uncharacterised protein [Klebsiella michiganensis]